MNSLNISQVEQANWFFFPNPPDLGSEILWLLVTWSELIGSFGSFFSIHQT